MGCITPLPSKETKLKLENFWSANSPKIWTLKKRWLLTRRESGWKEKQFGLVEDSIHVNIKLMQTLLSPSSDKVFGEKGEDRTRLQPSFHLFHTRILINQISTPTGFLLQLRYHWSPLQEKIGEEYAQLLVVYLRQGDIWVANIGKKGSHFNQETNKINPASYFVSRNVIQPRWMTKYEGVTAKILTEEHCLS